MMGMPENAAALVGREFVHFKGGHYRLRAFATDSETCETVVVYEALYGEGGLWVRPAKMFFETVTRDGRTFPRFRLRGDSKQTHWDCPQHGDGCSCDESENPVEG